MAWPRSRLRSVRPGREMNAAASSCLSSRLKASRDSFASPSSRGRRQTSAPTSISPCDRQASRAVAVPSRDRQPAGRHLAGKICLSADSSSAETPGATRWFRHANRNQSRSCFIFGQDDSCGPAQIVRSQPCQILLHRRATQRRSPAERADSASTAVSAAVVTFNRPPHPANRTPIVVGSGKDL